ncbi:MAG: hypothetical protein NTY45_11895 [Elusimicrobia bacterium]|nr:hypothetical protein [Elusimicrobiota bacterium]
MRFNKMSVKGSGKKFFKIILGGALALSIFASLTQAAGSAGDRYGCIAKVEGRYFTDGTAALKELPCEVAPAAVDRLAKARKVDEGTDQINFDYFWGQEYYLTGKVLTEIGQIEEAKSGRAVLFTYQDVCRRGSLEASGALLEIKEALGFSTAPNTAGIAGQIYSVCEPFNSARYPNAVLEQSSENINQLLLYASTDNNSTRKFMGAVNWLPRTPETAMARRTPRNPLTAAAK